MRGCACVCVGGSERFAGTPNLSSARTFNRRGTDVLAVGECLGFGGQVASSPPTRRGPCGLILLLYILWVSVHVSVSCMSANVHVTFWFVCMRGSLHAVRSERREREVDQTIPRWLKF